MQQGCDETGPQDRSVDRARRPLQIWAEADLVRAAREGCPSSFAELVRRHSGRLYSFLYRRTGDVSDAEDLTQETFVRAYQNLDRYRDRCQFSTWLFTIGSRLATSHLRQKRRRPVAALVDEVACDRPGPACLAEQREQSERLWALAEQLPANQRMVLQLHYAAGLPVREMAQVLGKTPVHIKVLLYRARVRMANKLQAPSKRMDPDPVARVSQAVGERAGA